MYFPAWYMGRHPDRQIICATYSDEFAQDFGRNVRGIVAGDEFKALFPQVSLSADAKASDRWTTNKGGIYKSSGIGGSLTGRGAHLAVIDDPVKNRDTADSKLERDRAWNWYRSVLYTRLMPGGAIILIATRWNDDDLIGRVLEEAEKDGVDQWDLVSLPALADEDKDPLGREKGQALWPEWYPVEELERIKSTVGPREWSALYQQKPAQDEGAFFKREWFRDFDLSSVKSKLQTDIALSAMDGRHHRRPSFSIYAASDFAVTADGGDYTVHVIVGVDAVDDIYVLDVWREQTEASVWIDKMADMILKWKPITWGLESGQIIKGIGPFMHRRLKEKRAYCHFEEFASSHDKPTRARAIQARASMGKVLIPFNEPWATDFIFELSRFPAGKLDDQVDGFSLIGRMMDSMYTGRRDTTEEVDAGEFAPTAMKDIFQKHINMKRRRGSRREAIVVPSYRVDIEEAHRRQEEAFGNHL